MNFLITILGLSGLIAVTQATEGFEVCGAEGGTISYLDFGGCVQPPCHVVAGEEVIVKGGIGETFMASNSLTLIVEVEVLGEFWDVTGIVGVQSDVCLSIEPPCPVEVGMSYDFESSVVTQEIFAGFDLPTRIRILDDDGNTGLCVQFQVVFD